MSGCAHMNPEDFCGSCASDKLREARREIATLKAQAMAAPVDPSAWWKLSDEASALRAKLADEMGWLIESTASHGDGLPCWWAGKQDGTVEEWTTEANAAVRFSRRQDAEACRLILGDAHLSKATEHVWLRALASGEESR